MILAGGLEHDWIMTFPSYWEESSSQLTNSYFSEGLRPPNRWTKQGLKLEKWYVQWCWISWIISWITFFLGHELQNVLKVQLLVDLFSAVGCHGLFQHWFQVSTFKSSEVTKKPFILFRPIPANPSGRHWQQWWGCWIAFPFRHVGGSFDGAGLRDQALSLHHSVALASDAGFLQRPGHCHWLIPIASLWGSWNTPLEGRIWDDVDADHLLHRHDHYGVFAQVALQDLQGGCVWKRGI